MTKLLNETWFLFLSGRLRLDEALKAIAGTVQYSVYELFHGREHGLASWEKIRPGARRIHTL